MGRLQLDQVVSFNSDLLPTLFNFSLVEIALLALNQSFLIICEEVTLCFDSDEFVLVDFLLLLFAVSLVHFVINAFAKLIFIAVGPRSHRLICHQIQRVQLVVVSFLHLFPVFNQRLK